MRSRSDSVSISDLPARLARTWPDLAGREIRERHEGADKIALELEGGLIVRFAKNEAAAKTMEVERELLARLAPRLSLRVPRIDHARLDSDWYEFIPGVPLTAEAWLALSKPKRERVTSTLSEFFAELHCAVTTEEAAQVGVLTSRWPLAPETIRRALHGNWKNARDEQFAEKQMQRWERLPHLPSEHRLIHNDLGGHNLAFDPSAGEIRGVFDFGDTCVANVHQDFHYLASYREGFDEAVLSRYEQLSGLSLRRDEVAIRHALNLLSHAAYAAEAPEERSFAEKLEWITNLRERS